MQDAKRIVTVSTDHTTGLETVANPSGGLDSDNPLGTGGLNYSATSPEKPKVDAAGEATETGPRTSAV